ncbi:MAG: cellulase family glycosylhydrolase [Blautia sp.]|nr:cellulase family glycosylhydrolase [Blautia sp.]
MRIFKGYQRGINLGGWLSQCESMEDAHFRTFIQKEDIAGIASWGLDHVRLPIDCDVVFENMEGELHDRMRYVDACISWCGEYGLNLVLDLHKTYGYMFDRAVVPDPDAFFNDEKLQDAFLRLWRTMAERYGKLSDRVAFELLNEVTNPDQAQNWNRIAARAIKTIREIAPDTYLLVGGVNNNSVTRVPLLDPPADEKIVYNFHCYEPLMFTHQKAGWVDKMPADFSISYPETMGAYRQAADRLGIWQADDISPEDTRLIGPEYFEELFRCAIEAAKKWDVPLYCGEYGVIDRVDVEQSVRWYRDIHSTFEKYGIGRAAWSYRRMDFGLADARYDAVREQILQYL